MRGEDRQAGGLFSYVDLKAQVPADHPPRSIRAIVDAALRALSVEFEVLYSHLGRPSIPPERLLRALLRQAFYSACSERPPALAADDALPRLEQHRSKRALWGNSNSRTVRYGRRRLQVTDLRDRPFTLRETPWPLTTATIRSL